MPFKPYVRIVPNKFASGHWQWNTQIHRLKYIGPYYRQRLNALNIYTIDDFINHIANVIYEDNQNNVLDRVLASIASITMNERRYQCTQNNYLPRPVNRFAFNILSDVLDYGRQVQRHPALMHLPPNIAGQFICNWNEGTDVAADGAASFCNYTPDYGSVGDNAYAMRTCPCLSDANQCNANPNCMWINGEPSGCIPRHTRYDERRNAPDVFPFAGDWNLHGVPDNEHRAPGTSYITIPQNQGPGRAGVGAFVIPGVYEEEEEPAPHNWESPTGHTYTSQGLRRSWRHQQPFGSISVNGRRRSSRRRR